MRLVLVVPAFPKLSETFIVSKFLGLLERGWDVHVVCNQSDPQEWARFPELQRSTIRARVHVVWPTRPRWLAASLMPWALLRCIFQSPRASWRYFRRGFERPGFDILKQFYLDAAHIALDPDIIHFEFGPLAVGRMVLKDALGCRITVSFRGYDLNYVGLDNTDYYDEVWEKADGIHLLGRDLWQRAQQRGCPSNKLHVLIPPAVDPVFFDPGERHHREVVGTPERPLRLLSVGRLDWRKGYEYALEAVRLLEEGGIRCQYRIVGDGAYLEAVAFARHQLGLENSVELMGALSRDNVRREMLWADVFLHAAVSEGFCNAVVEAQAMRLPVVCSDAGGLPENIAHGATGFIVPRRDPRALAGRLLILARDPERRQRMGEAGRRRVVEKFRLPEQIEQFDRFYRRVLMGCGRVENTLELPALPESDSKNYSNRRLLAKKSL